MATFRPRRQVNQLAGSWASLDLIELLLTLERFAAAAVAMAAARVAAAVALATAMYSLMRV